MRYSPCFIAFTLSQAYTLHVCASSCQPSLFFAPTVSLGLDQCKTWWQVQLRNTHGLLCTAESPQLWSILCGAIFCAAFAKPHNFPTRTTAHHVNARSQSVVSTAVFSAVYGMFNMSLCHASGTAAATQNAVALTSCWVLSINIVMTLV